MKPRYIILTVIGILVYFGLANFHGNLKKRNPLIEPLPVIEQSEAAISRWKNRAQEYKDQLDSALQKTSALELQLQEVKELAAGKDMGEDQLAAQMNAASILEEQLQHRNNLIQGLEVQLAQEKEKVKALTENTGSESEVLQQELAKRDAQIKELLQGAEAVASTTRKLQDDLNSAQQTITELTADRDALTLELSKAQTSIDHLNEVRSALDSKKEGLATANDRIKALASRVQQSAAELAIAEDTISQLRTALSEAELGGTKLENIHQDREKAINALQKQVEEQSTTIGSLKTRLSENLSQTALLDAALKKADLKAEAMFQFGQEKEKQLAPFSQRIALLENQLSDSQQALDSALAKAADLEQQLNEQIVVGQTKSMEEKDIELVRLREALAAANSSINKSLENGQELVMEVANLTESSLVLNNQISSLESELAAAHATIEESLSTLADREAALASTQEKLSGAISQQEILQQQLAEKDLVLAKTEQVVEELKTALAEKSNALAAFQEELTAAQAALVDQQAEIDASPSREAELSNALAEKTLKVEELTLQLAQLQTSADEIETLRAGLQEKSNALAAAEEQLAQALTDNDEIERMQANIAAQTEALEEARQANQFCEEKILSLNEQVSNQAQLITEKEQRIVSLQNETATIRSETEELMSSLLEKEKAAETALLALQDKDTQIASFSREIEQLNGQLAVSTDQLAVLKEKLDVATSEKEKAGEQQAALEKVSLEKDKLAAQLAEQSAALQKAQEEATSLAAVVQQLRPFEETAAKMKEALAKQEEQLATLQQKIPALEANIASLTRERDALLLYSRDSDQDGVSDAADSCPDTLSGSIVDATGCELDSDNDGLVDRIDLCPDTSAGKEIDELGCVKDSAIVLQGVSFASGTADLTDDAKSALIRVARVLKQFPGMNVEVAGYTDNVGDENRNQQVSRLRAEAVLQYLVAQGIPSDQLLAKGYGLQNPVADNSTAAGRAKNRRVELHRIAPAQGEVAPKTTVQ